MSERDQIIDACVKAIRDEATENPMHVIERYAIPVSVPVVSVRRAVKAISAVRSALLPVQDEEDDSQDDGEAECCVCGRFASACGATIVDRSAYPDEGEWFCSRACNDAYHEAEGDYTVARAIVAQRYSIDALQIENKDLLHRLWRIIGIANGDDGPPESEWALDDPEEAVRELRNKLPT